MSASLTAGTIQRHEQRMKRLNASIDAVDNGLQIALSLEHRRPTTCGGDAGGHAHGNGGYCALQLLFQFWNEWVVVAWPAWP